MRMMKLACGALALAMLCMGNPAWADLPQPAKDFADAASNIQQFEAAAARMAVQRSRNEQVVAFARLMAADYGAAQVGMTDIGSDVEDAAHPGTLDPEHQAMLDRLYAYSSPTFDRLYVAMQMPEHTKLLTLFKTYAESGADGDLKDFAAGRIPQIRQNQEHARRLQFALPPDQPRR